MRAVLAAVALLAGLFAPVPAAALADAHSGCAPPCGPIPVIITLTLDKSKNVDFDAKGDFSATGKIQYYFDIDQNGYAYDPTKEVAIELKVNKQPPWVQTTVEPTKVVVPIRPQDGCPTCVSPEGSPPETQFNWEHDLKVTVHKTRDFSADELRKWLKSDGTYRVSINAISNDSMAGTDATGKPAGLMEGYGVKEIRFLAPAALKAQLGQTQAPAKAPGLDAFGFVAALGVAMFLLRRE
jgi:hypothetical protein